MSVEQPEASTTTSGGATTGNAAVDGVLASLDTLADLPVAEHVAVFERAHEQLRAALDAPAGPRPPAESGQSGHSGQAAEPAQPGRLDD